jgi:hypothetical protein
VLDGSLAPCLVICDFDTARFCKIPWFVMALQFFDMSVFFLEKKHVFHFITSHWLNPKHFLNNISALSISASQISVDYVSMDRIMCALLVQF